MEQKTSKSILVVVSKPEKKDNYIKSIHRHLISGRTVVLSSPYYHMALFTELRALFESLKATVGDVGRGHCIMQGSNTRVDVIRCEIRSLGYDFKKEYPDTPVHWDKRRLE